MDAVELIRRRTERAWLRCDACGLRQQREVPMPVGGAPCDACGATLRETDTIEFAGLPARAFALVIDAGFFAVPYVLLSLGLDYTEPWIPRDEEGNLTNEALIRLRILVASWFFAYLWIGEAVGASIGKKAMGIRVIGAESWRRPGITRGLVRTIARLLTAATFGLGFIVAKLDPERRALHDWIAGTRVIER